jgi:hypothetical protein
MADPIVSYQNCTICGDNLSSYVGSMVGSCQRCRENGGYTNCSGCGNSSYKESTGTCINPKCKYFHFLSNLPPAPTAQAAPSPTKVYKGECPCGLTRMCEYHFIQKE